MDTKYKYNGNGPARTSGCELQWVWLDFHLGTFVPQYLLLFSTNEEIPRPCLLVPLCLGKNHGSRTIIAYVEGERRGITHLIYFQYSHVAGTHSSLWSSSVGTIIYAHFTGAETKAPRSQVKLIIAKTFI